MSKLLKTLRNASSLFIGILLVLVVVGGIFAILSHMFKSEIAAVIGAIFLAMFVTQLTTHRQ